MSAKVQPRDAITMKSKEFTKPFFKVARFILLLGAVYPGGSRQNDFPHSKCLSRLKKSHTVLCTIFYLIQLCIICYDTLIRVLRRDDLTRELGYLVIVASSAYLTVVLSISVSQRLPKLEEHFLGYEQKYGVTKGVSRLPLYIKLSVIWLLGSVATSFTVQLLFMKKSVRIFCDALPLCSIPEPWYDILFPLHVWILIISFLQWQGLILLCTFFALFLAREFSQLCNDFEALVNSNDGVEERFKKLVEKHNGLVDLLGEVNSCFQHFSFVSLFLLIPVNCFFLYASLNSNDNTTEFLYFLSGLSVSLSVKGFRLVMEARVNRKAHQPLDYLWKLQKEHFSDRGLQNLTLFSNRLMGENIGYNIYGLLTINMPTLLGIFGTLTTYIIIVVQFRPTDAPCQCDCMKNVSYCINL